MFKHPDVIVNTVAVKIDFLRGSKGLLRLVDIGSGTDSGHGGFPPEMRRGLMLAIQQKGRKPIACLEGGLLLDMLSDAEGSPLPVHRNPQTLADALRFESPVTGLSSIAHAGTALTQVIPICNTKKNNPQGSSIVPPAGFAQVFENKAWWHLLMKEGLPDEKKPQSFVFAKGSILLPKEGFMAHFKVQSPQGFFRKEAVSLGRGRGVEYYKDASDLYDALLKDSYVRNGVRYINKSFIIEPAYLASSEKKSNPTGRAFIVVSLLSSGAVQISVSHAIWIYPTETGQSSTSDYIANLTSYSAIKQATPEELKRLEADLGDYCGCFLPCFSNDLYAALPQSQTTRLLRKDLNHSWNRRADTLSERNTSEEKEQAALRLAKSFLSDRLKTYLGLDHHFHDFVENCMPTFLNEIESSTAADVTQVVLYHPNPKTEENDTLISLRCAAALIQFFKLGIFKTQTITPFRTVLTCLTANYLRLKKYKTKDFSSALVEAIQGRDCKTIIILLYTHQVQVLPEHVQSALRCVQVESASRNSELTKKVLAVVRHVHWAQYCQGKRLSYSTRDIDLALRQAAFKGDLGSVRMLLSTHEANPNVVSASGKTAIVFAEEQALKKKDPKKWRECLKLLRSPAPLSSNHGLFKSEYPTRQPKSSRSLHCFTSATAVLVVVLLFVMIANYALTEVREDGTSNNTCPAPKLSP